MSRKTLLTILASAELFLGAYFVLAFLAWFAKLYLFNEGNKSFSVMLIVWLVLAATCFGIYGKTMSKIKSLEFPKVKPSDLDRLVSPEPAQQPTHPPAEGPASHSLKG
jgi:hypothetical protein